jgi:hypothetical protein
MMKKLLTIAVLVLWMTACSTGRNEPSEIVSSMIERGADYQTIQLSQSQILFPYGVRVRAEAVTLNLLVSTSQESAPDRVEDLQRAIDTITELASQTDTITLEQVSVNQINGSYPREDSSTSNIQNLDTSAVIIKLATQLAQHDNDFMETVADFNVFLESIKVSETITINAVSIEADLGELEPYRSEIIAQFYQQLESVKEEYGPEVKFGVTGLYDPLKKIQLSDTEYYLYLEPVVTVIEF